MAATGNNFISPIAAVAFTAVATTAETAFHLPTSAVTLILPTTDVPDGARLTSVHVIPRASMSGATTVALYRVTGTTYVLINAIVAADVTPSSSVAPLIADFGYSEDNPLFLHAGEGLAFSIGRNVANGVVGRAEGGKY